MDQAFLFESSKSETEEIDTFPIHEKEEESVLKTRKLRNKYFFRLLRDPTANAIPENIRSRELNHAEQIPTLRALQKAKNGENTSLDSIDFDWNLAGPPAVGGRTRALGIDNRNSDIIIAGGVSGGIWKSTDGGDSWEIKTPGFENFSVTTLAQDPTNPDTWYYAGGELLGNSASSHEVNPAPALYYGAGVYRSTDNGETWSRIPGTADENTQLDSPFDFVNRIVISPETGTLFIASNDFGIIRSPNGDNYDNLVLGGSGEHRYTDVAVGSDGTAAAVLSSANSSDSEGNPGIFVSEDDGQNWTEITPSSFPSNHNRSVLNFAPSNPDILYVYTQKDMETDSSNQGVSLYKLDLSGNPVQANDRAGNFPEFTDGPIGGIDTQGGYNMTISIKPDNPNFVTVGATNLFRSTDGFATEPSNNSESEKDRYWIGGFAQSNDGGFYPEQHPDQHVQIYDPDNPDRLWVGHDGGISVTDDITQNEVSWTGRNEGYIVTQFYDVTIYPVEGDERLVGGTQDNGSPFFAFNYQQNTPTPSEDASGADGGYSFFTENFLYTSNQWSPSSENSLVYRFNEARDFAYVQPARASTEFFINPYVIDPNDETIMYYPGGGELYRNTRVDEISSQNAQGTDQYWETMDEASLANHSISALAVSDVPENILYYAGSSINRTPVIRRLDNASAANSPPAEIDIPDAPTGAFVHNIAINPNNANDVLVVMSNYNIVGLYHTSDGGSSWQAVEGNLTGSSDPASPNAGPSLRSATIVPAESGPIYLLGTSTGIYATQNLDGSQTQWGRQSAFNDDGNPDIGYSVVEDIDSRKSDGDVAVGSHGRGIFVGDFQGEVASPSLPVVSLENAMGRAGDEITIQADNFQFSSTPEENEVYFGNKRAEVIDATPEQITTVVPRATLSPESEGRTVLLQVTNNSGQDPHGIPFTLLSPDDFTVKQNYPNPFNPITTIPFDIPSDSRVTLTIYNTSGQKVLQPIEQKSYNAGTYNQRVDLSGLASGTYIYRLSVRSQVRDRVTMQSKKMTFVK